MKRTTGDKIPADEMLAYETRFYQQGCRSIAGVDEVGRGPLAGPVTAAAVILDPARPIAGLTDSKKLTAPRREALFAEILRKGNVAVAFVPVEVIDQINIRESSLLAMRKAIEALSIRPDQVLVDGRDVPQGLAMPGLAIIGGDGKSASIAAASIVAKVLRDRMMARASTGWPGYGFEKHAGYGTPQHKARIAQLGPCPIHRLSFAPFKNGTE